MEIQKYPLPMRIFHWTIAVLVIVMLIVGFSLATWLDQSPDKKQILMLHISTGILILMLVIGRLLTRIFYHAKVPPLAPTLPFYERALAYVVHRLLYVFLFVMPLSGFLMVSYNPKNTGIFFYGIPLPSFLPKDEALSKLFWEVHEVSAFCLITLIVLHLAGVIKHRFYDKPEHDSLAKMI